MNLERTPKNPAAKTGFFATLGGLLYDRGTGASPARRRAFAVLIALALSTTAFLAVTAAPAPAAGPPYVQVAEIQNAGSEFYSESVAANPHNGHIYVADSGAHVIRDYASTSDTSPTVWNGSNTPAGEFTGKLALAVENATGDVYVADSSHAVIDKFDQDGNLIASFGDSTPTPNGQLAGSETTAGSFSPASSVAFGLAVDQATGDLYVIDAGHEVIDAFTAAGEFLPASSITEKPGELYGGGGAYTDGIAVNDATGELLVSDSWDLHLYRFELTTGAFLGSNAGSETPDGSFGAGYISVAVDQANGNVFVVDSQHEVIDEFTPGLTYAERQVKVGPGSSVRSVGVDPETGDVYAPDENHGNVRVFQIKQPAQPVAIASVTAVTDTTATLRGSVNPGGLPTTYHFEYISQADWQANGESFAGLHPATVLPVPDASIGSGEAEVQTAPQPIVGLLPGATYRYRLLATNSLSPSGGTIGPDRAFTTQPASASALLPDARQWEFVSSPQKHGANIYALDSGFNAATLQASRQGDAITYATSAPIETEPQGNYFSQVLSARGPAGWSSRTSPSPFRIPRRQGRRRQRVSLLLLRPLRRRRPALRRLRTLALPGSLRTDPLPAHRLPGRRTHRLLRRFLLPPPGHRRPGHRQRPPRHRIRPVPGGRMHPREHCGPRFRRRHPRPLPPRPRILQVGLTATPGDEGGLYEWTAAPPAAGRCTCSASSPAANRPRSPPARASATRARRPQRDLRRRLPRLLRPAASRRTTPPPLPARPPPSEETIQLDAVQGGTGAGQLAAPVSSSPPPTARASSSPTPSSSPPAPAPAGKQRPTSTNAGIEAAGRRTRLPRLTDLTPDSGGESAAVRAP